MSDFDEIPKRKRRMKILEELDDIGDMSVVSLSDINKKEKTKEESTESEDVEDSYGDDWMDTLMSIGKSSSKKKKGVFKNLDELLDGGKKKKKKKQKGHLTDYNKEFETETAMLKNLLVDQNKFVDDLQSKFDAMKKQKSSVRGVGKYESDLVSNINTARNISLSLVKEIVSTKKTIADLAFKEKKEFGTGEVGPNNSADYASSFLKQLVSVDRKSIVGDEQMSFDDVDEDDLFDATSESLINNEEYVERADEVSRYLKYENRGVNIYVIYDAESETWEFVAEDKDGVRIPDYPVPEPMTKLSFNFSTGIAKDSYGESYKIITRETL